MIRTSLLVVVLAATLDTSHGLAQTNQTEQTLTLERAADVLQLIRPVRRRSAKGFAVPLVNGGTFRLNDHRGKVVLVNFWATWCVPCREEMPSLERLWKAYDGEPFIVLGISTDSSAGEVSGFVAQHRLTFPIGLDLDKGIAASYGARALPTTVIVDVNGESAAIALGPREWDGEAARALVRTLLK